MVVIVFTVGAAVKPAANSLPEDTKEPEPTQPTTEAVQQEPYPFNLDGTQPAVRVQPDICRYWQNGMKNVCTD